MKQEIRFKGLSLDHDELAAQHGELALCGNVELHDGALRPSILNGNSLGGGNALTGTLLYVHINASYKNYISFYNGGLRWAQETVSGSTTTWSEHTITGLSGLSLDNLSITSVGNTLCVLTSTGLYYILFKNGDYKYLGQKPPFVELQFNMNRQTGDDTVETDIEFISQSGGFIADDHGNDWIDFPNSLSGQGGWSIREDYRATITEQVMAATNKLISEASEKSLFHAPFLIRYCYRMVDGKSFILHSPVVLMMPAAFSSASQPSEVAAGVKGFHRHPISGNRDMYYNYSSKFTCNISILTAKLQVKCLNTSVFDSLEEWSDVIRSLDIFISPQITRLDATKTISFIRNSFNTRLGTGLINGDWDNYNAATNTTSDTDYSYLQGGLDMPLCTVAEFKEKVKNTSTFFKLTSFNTKELRNSVTSSFADLRIEKNIVPNIVVQKQMTDDYKTHNTLIPISSGKGGMFVYNHRLNVYGMSEQLFAGFTPDVLFPYMKGDQLTNNHIINKVIVTLDTEDGLKRVEKTCSTHFFYDAICQYVFFPDARANSITFQYDASNYQYKFKLDEHLTLNGAFYAYSGISNFALGSGTNIVTMPNKIYTSRTDNPFYFPNLVGESGINSVGTGTILGLAVVTRALSPSQVGDHDLTIFSTDGIWVAKVSSTGTYSNLHHISNDVCVNSKSICQLDQSVIFATDRYLARFIESDGVSISDVLNGPIQKLSTMLSEFYALFNTGGTYASDGDIKKLLDFETGAIDYFSKGRVVYDYESKRLLILPQTLSASATNVILVFSITDLTWSTMVIPAIKSIIPGYSCPYYQLSDSKVYSMDKTYPQKETVPSYSTGIIITRTLAFSETMDVIQGFQQLCNLTTKPLLYIYGSNDQTSWKLIGYSNRPYANYLPGHPFRYFRIAMYLTMAKVERYQELVLDIVNKYAKL